MAPKKKPTDELKDQRVPIMMSEDELKAIDDWSFANRIRSRGEAIRRLCTMGLTIDKTMDPILALTAQILRRRINDGGTYRKARYDEMPLEMVAAQAKLDVNVVCLGAMKDHARLVLAIYALSEPILELRGNPEIEAAMKEAASIAPKLQDMADDIEELKLDEQAVDDDLRQRLIDFKKPKKIDD